jgi:uncharacterized membrane-anchored protein
MTIVYSSLNHAMRVPLAAEIHSRPFMKLDAPELISHFAIYRNPDQGAGAPSGHSHHRTLNALCKHFGVSAPADEAKYFFHDFGRFRLKWECHTEFSTYTFALLPDQQYTTDEAFDHMPVTHLPQEWLLTLKGRLMVAAHVVLERGSAEMDALQRIFEGNTLAGSQVMQGGEVYSDFAIQSDGFSRFVIRDVGMRAQQAGRLVQRVLEIETYRMFALLGLPQAQQAAPALNAIEGELVTLAAAMVQTDAEQLDAGMGDGAMEQKLLGEITRLAARIEKLSLETSYRFSASKAYFRLVHARIDELREIRIEGLPNVAEFMDRRLTPAMNTCEAVAARQEALARRVANTNDLLRTRVGIIQEQQNRKILQSMNRRAAQQLRLQQAVEGLSVAAISYYVVGLIGYSTKAVKAAGIIGNPDVVIGFAVPLVLAGVWLSLRNMHKRLHAA